MISYRRRCYAIILEKYKQSIKPYVSDKRQVAAPCHIALRNVSLEYQTYHYRDAQTNILPVARPSPSRAFLHNTKMAKRHKHMVGYRIFFVIAIPTMYFLCISMMGLISDSSKNTDNTANWRKYIDNTHIIDSSSRFTRSTSAEVLQESRELPLKTACRSKNYKIILKTIFNNEM